MSTPEDELYALQARRAIQQLRDRGFHVEPFTIDLPDQRDDVEDAASDDFTHYWRVRKFLPERFGQRCRVFARGKRMNSIGVEFTDGARYVTIKWFVRKV